MNGSELKISKIANFSEAVTEQTDIVALAKLVLSTCVDLVRVEQASLMLFDVPSRRLQFEATHGFEPIRQKPPTIELTEDVTNWVYEGGEILALAEEDPQKFLLILDEDECRHLGGEIRFPFFLENEMVGLINLGEKSDGSNYSVEEIDLFRSVIGILRLRLEYLFARDAHVTARNLTTQTHVRSSHPAHQHLTPIVKMQNRQQDILGRSESIAQILSLIERVAFNDATVLISGESGTGKELVAKAIHQKSTRKNRQMVAMNCAALPDTLVEAELFGHEKGAFTGAVNQKQGKFEAAHESSLFLDEIGDMSLATQAKVLRILQDGTFQRLGGNKTYTADVRLIAATNHDLLEDVNHDTFREDLYYRIAVVQIDIPPLRQRREDIPILANHFFAEFNEYYGKNLVGISEEVMDWLLKYDFPGNIRELRNMMERAVIMENGEWISLHFIPIAKMVRTNVGSIDSQDITLEEIEKRHIERIVTSVKFNKSEAARKLGIARKTLREKMEKYNIHQI